MYMFLGKLLNVAVDIGEIKNIEMSEACTYLPARIELNGITHDGEQFEIQLRVGDPIGKDS